MSHPVNADTLPDTWPSSLAIRLEASTQVELSPMEPGGRSSMINKGSIRALKTSAQMGSQSSVDFSTSASRRRFVIHPNSVGKLLYDILGATFLLVDVMAIPALVAWEITLSGAMLWFAWLTAVFWTLDIGISFLTATQRSGELIFDLRVIRRDYLKTWFLPDAAIVLCDWLTLAVLKSTGWRLLRFAKLGRFLRLAAIFRMTKISRVIEGVMEVCLSDTGKLLVRFMKMFVLTLIYGHFIACIWYFIGRPAALGEIGGWTVAEIMTVDGMEFSERSIGYQYATSFHWAMSQITLGAMEVPSTNIVERFYTVACLLSGLLFGSTLVSSLSAMMLEAQMDKRDINQKLQQMRRYLREQRVDRTVAAQVERQLAERLATKAKLTQAEVSGFAKISASLRAQLQFEMFAPYLKSLPLFRLWISLDTAFVRTFCRECMDFKYLPLQDDLFSAGNPAKYAYYFYSGRMTYTQLPESSPVTDLSSKQVDAESWLAEAALWTVWMHVGTAVADEYTEVAQLDVEKIAVPLKRSIAINQLTHDYCKSFHRRLQAAKPPTSVWPDDLQVPLTEWHDMVLAMSRDSQAVIGLDALRHATLRSLWKKSARGLTELGTEVETGKSTVMLTAAGELQRVTSLVVFKIYNAHGNLLIQIGKEESGRMKHSCQLLGGKQDRGELVTDTFERLLGSKLTKIADYVEVIKTERETETKESKEFGVNTKYLRNIVHAQLGGDVELDDIRIPSVSSFAGADVASPNSQTPRSSSREQTASSHSLPRPDRSFSKEQLPPEGRANRRGHTRELTLTRDRAMLLQMEALKERDALLFRDKKGGAALCIWASEREFECIKSSDCEEMLVQWVGELTAEAERQGLATRGRADS
jgi:hypothetical protein